MHHLNTEEELLLIWLWQNSPNGMGFCRSVIDGEPVSAPVWDRVTKHVTVRLSGVGTRLVVPGIGSMVSDEKTVTFRGYLDSRVTSKHIKSLAYSPGYGGPLVKIYHGHEIDPETGHDLGRCKPWQRVTIEITVEGRRWADSPYMQSKYPRR